MLSYPGTAVAVCCTGKAAGSITQPCCSKSEQLCKKQRICVVLRQLELLHAKELHDGMQIPHGTPCNYEVQLQGWPNTHHGGWAVPHTNTQASLTEIHRWAYASQLTHKATGPYATEHRRKQRQAAITTDPTGHPQSLCCQQLPQITSKA